MPAALPAAGSLATSPALQLDGELIAIYAIGLVAAFALLFFVVKFAAGIREYRQAKRRDSEERGESDGGER